jgi:hypothetical protein
VNRSIPGGGEAASGGRVTGLRESYPPSSVELETVAGGQGWNAELNEGRLGIMPPTNSINTILVPSDRQESDGM